MTATADRDLTETLAERVRTARDSGHALRIVGGDSKRWYGRHVEAEPLDLAGHAGVLNYDPAELVVTVRSGTRLADVVALLAAQNQRLPFEPPSFGDTATIGGTVASGLAGPARVAFGPVRDYVLGARLMTGDGQVLKFGGEVMKNVAGYDVARLLAGSLGVLGALLDVSLKVLPLPAGTRTLRQRIDAPAAIERLADAARRGAPVTGSFWCDGELHVRLEGSPGALASVEAELGGDALADDEAARFWHDVREQRHPFFCSGAGDLWRVHALPVMPLATLRPSPEDRLAWEWNGAQRWWRTESQADVRPSVTADGASSTLFRSDRSAAEVFAPLPASLLTLHRAVKSVYDPSSILNPGRMYADV